MGAMSEHLDENALAQAASQKSTSQQSVNPLTSQAAAMGQKMKQGGFPGAGGMGGMAGGPGKAPRPVGTFAEELIQNPAHDILDALKSFFSINTWLGMKPPQPDSPEETARKRKMHQRFQKLDQEQQQVVQRKYQEAMQKKKMEEEQKAQRKHMEEQQKAQQVDMPSSPKKGPVGPGSKKQKAVQKLTQDRKTLSGPSSAN